MSSPVYCVGDLVRITYEGHIDSVDEADPHWYSLRVGQHAPAYLCFRTDIDSTQHELLTAAEWPPLRGDTWTDGTGEEWFAHAAEDEGTGIALTSEFGARFEDEDGLKKADELYGPFRLKVPGKQRLEREDGQ